MIHANNLFQITWTAKSLFSTYNELPFGTVRFVSYLPLSHIAGQVCMQVLVQSVHSECLHVHMYNCLDSSHGYFSLHTYVNTILKEASM